MANINNDFLAKKCPPGQYRDEKLPGFVLKVSGTGAKSYQVHGRIKGGGLVRHTIGKHGAPWTSKTAREEAARIIHMMKLGVDPREIKAERAARVKAVATKKTDDDFRAAVTLRRVFEDWCADERKTQQSTKNLYQDCLFKHLKDWLDLPLVTITEEMVVKRYDKVADETVSSAGNTFRALRRMFYWAMEEYKDGQQRPVIVGNPVRILAKRKKWRKVSPRRDFIDFDDLRGWFESLSIVDNQSYRDYFVFLLVTGLRKEEAAAMLWKNVNFKNDTFTVVRKGGQEQTLPLTNYTKQLLQSRRPKDKVEHFVFPGPGKTGHIVNVRYYQEKIIEESKIDFTPHALRRTFSYAAAKVRLGESERKALLDHHDKSDVTDYHYTPWQVEDLREPLAHVESFILKHAQNKPGRKLKVV